MPPKKFWVDGDLSVNPDSITAAITESKEKEVEVIVFPESGLLDWINPDAPKRLSNPVQRPRKRFSDHPA